MNIFREIWNVGDTAHTLVTLWDNEDAICGIRYNGTPYYFLKNLQGDIVAITDANGEVVARYSYDAWGVSAVVSDTSDDNIATVNPFRYRGYYYDAETQLYYLQSRYYNPASARWLSMEPNAYCGLFDSEADLLGYNTYVYCANTPISYKDSNGESILGVLIGIGVGALIGALAGWGYAKYFNIPKDKTWKYILGGALIGGILGGCIGYAIGAGSGAVLWSGEGMSKATAAFAKKNGLKILSQTLRGRILNILATFLPNHVMRPLWEAASVRFLLSYAGKQIFIHIFITADNYSKLSTVFNSVEMQVIAELGMKIIWHFVK